MTTIATYSQFAFDEPNVIAITAPATDGAIVVCFTLAPGFTVSSVTDSAGGTYTLELSRLAYGGVNTQYIYRRHNIDDAPTTVTVTLGGTLPGATVYVFVINGMAAGSITPVVTQQADTSYSVTQTASFTTTATDDIGIIYWSDSSGSVNTADTSGWSMASGSNAGAHNSALGAAGAKTAQFTAADGCERRFNIVTYPAAAGGGGASTQGAGVIRQQNNRRIFGIRR